MSATSAPATPLPAGGTAATTGPTTAPQSMMLRPTPDFAMPGNPYGAAAFAPSQGRAY